jgi:hypothetical protein
VDAFDLFSDPWKGESMSTDASEAVSSCKPPLPDTGAVEAAISVLDSNRIMAISTVRPDGWPQTTIVGYANVGLLVYFMILPSSQKFANLQLDDRVSMAIGQEPEVLKEAKALFAGANAVEVTDAAERKEAWIALRNRHPNLFEFELPDRAESAVMSARCKHLSVLDYTKGLGHTETFTVEA